MTPWRWTSWRASHAAVAEGLRRRPDVVRVHAARTRHRPGIAAAQYVQLQTGTGPSRVLPAGYSFAASISRAPELAALYRLPLLWLGHGVWQPGTTTWGAAAPTVLVALMQNDLGLPTRIASLAAGLDRPDVQAALDVLDAVYEIGGDAALDAAAACWVCP